MGVGQTDLAGQAAHLAFLQLAHRKQRLAQLVLAQAVQKITLVFARVQAFEQLHSGALFTHAGVVAGGDFVGAACHGVV